MLICAERLATRREISPTWTDALRKTSGGSKVVLVLAGVEAVS